MSASMRTSRSGSILKISLGVALLLGIAAMASPALADGKHKQYPGAFPGNGHHYGHHKHGPEVVYVDRYYEDEPDVIYVERPVYVRERVYVEPRPVYVAPRPSINIVVPLFD